MDFLSDIARLRMTVFLEFPYLYDGDVAYEESYLATLAEADGAIVALARDGDIVVGASTGMPLAVAEEAWRRPFIDANLAVDSIFYCAESVLLPDHRGQGIGGRFFDIREEQARRLGLTTSTFCSVVREADHPMQPVAYRSNDRFWRRRGYRPTELTARYGWTDVGKTVETEKTLQFWTLDL